MSSPIVFLRCLLFGTAVVPVATVPAQPAQHVAAPPATSVSAPQHPSASPSHASSDLAHELVASDALVHGDVDAWMARVTDLLAAPHAAGAVDEAALRLFAQRADDLREPRAFQSALERLAAANSFDPHARAYLGRLVREQRLAHMDHDALARARESDQHPDCVSAFRILAPLAGPALDAGGEDLFADPGFDRAHKGLRDTQVRWSSGRRDPLRQDVAPSEWVEPVEGWALLDFEFDSNAAQPAAVEIDTRNSWGQRVLAYLMPTDRQWRGVTGPPDWAYALNGAPAAHVDPVSHEIDPVVLVPGVLRKGRNRLLVWCRVDAHPTFAVRVLVPERNDGGVCAGRPLELTPVRDEDLSAALGPPSSGTPPRIATLEDRLPRTTSADQALAGLVLSADARPIAGLALLRQAAEADADDLAIADVYARALHDSPYLPEVWRRSAARTRFEEIESRGRDLDADIQMADTLAHEDHEEDALAKLEQSRKDFAGSPEPLLEMARIYPRLEMSLQADKAREAAVGVAPHSTNALSQSAEHLAAEGLHSRAARVRSLLWEQAGADAGGLVALSEARAAAGDAAGALRALEDARTRAGGRVYTQELAEFQFDRERFGESDALYAELAAMYPRWEMPHLRRAEIAHRAGDAQAEMAQLEAAQALDPSSSAARRRLAALGVADRTEELFARFGADRDAALKSYDDKRWKDSVVRVLDSQVLRVFPDGSTAAITHDILQVKDLDGCKKQGSQRVGGEVEKLVTIKGSDGTELEPVEVDGEYVMPALKPGDFIERVSRDSSSAPELGLRVLESWRFASATEPFHVSRFVVILPRGHHYQLEQHDFDGTHDVIVDGNEEIHVFEVRDHDRLQPEPGAPPENWLVPWVQFGRHWDVAAEARHDLFEQARLATRQTPEVTQLCTKTIASVAGDEARAIALYDAVRSTVKKPNTQSSLSAAATLLGEAGNPAFLYASLLEAAGIDHELCWSSDVSPESDPDRDPFKRIDHWRKKLLVHVMPKDASPAWCDLSVREMPYGKMVDNAPRAEALTRDRVVELPDVDPKDWPGARFTIALDVQDDGSAHATVRQESSGNIGYIGKDRFKETPEARRKANAARLFGSVLRGFELSELESPGLDEDAPVTLVGHGNVPKFLDETDGGFSAKLPLPASSLSQGLAGGEGERKLPYFFPARFSTMSTADIALPKDLRFAGGPPETKESWHGCSYELTVDTAMEGHVKVTSKLVLAPFSIAPEDYPGLAEFCARVDAAERVPLRFAR